MLHWYSLSLSLSLSFSCILKLKYDCILYVYVNLYIYIYIYLWSLVRFLFSLQILPSITVPSNFNNGKSLPTTVSGTFGGVFSSQIGVAPRGFVGIDKYLNRLIKSYVIYYIIQFYNTPNIPTFIFLYNTLK